MVLPQSSRHMKQLMIVLLLVPLLLQLLFIQRCHSGRVHVKMYDHRAYHDPKELYGKGPWKYFGHGFGIDYGYEPNGKHTHERGYGFVKAFAREFCKDGKNCNPPDPNFWKKTSLKENGFSAEPYYGHPPADVQTPKEPEKEYITDKDEDRYKLWRQNFDN